MHFAVRSSRNCVIDIKKIEECTLAFKSGFYSTICNSTRRSQQSYLCEPWRSVAQAPARAPLELRSLSCLSWINSSRLEHILMQISRSTLKSIPGSDSQSEQLANGYCETVACSIAGSRMDYCNALLYGISDKNIHKLQQVQNILSRVVLKAPRQAPNEQMLSILHRLPIEHRIRNKKSVLTYKSVRFAQPVYLSEQFHHHAPVKQTRSAEKIYWLSPQCAPTSGLELWVMRHHLSGIVCQRILRKCIS